MSIPQRTNNVESPHGEWPRRSHRVERGCRCMNLVRMNLTFNASTDKDSAIPFHGRPVVPHSQDFLCKHLGVDMTSTSTGVSLLYNMPCFCVIGTLQDTAIDSSSAKDIPNDRIMIGHSADCFTIFSSCIFRMAMAAIARRRKLLDDDVLNALVDDSLDILDISGSDVTDLGLTKAAQICPNLRAVDISKCSKITVLGVSALVSQCHFLEILRCGGCTRSENTARRCLSILVPKLNTVEEESWEDLDNTSIVDGAQSLRWLVWPNIDPESKQRLATECPRIVVNPLPSPLSLRGTEVPHEALPGLALDEPCIEDIDPKAWAVSYAARSNILPVVSDGSPELSVAEKFRLAFVERDLRLAPKRAKNVRQRQRRAEREWEMGSADAKSIILASKFRKSPQNRI